MEHDGQMQQVRDRVTRLEELFLGQSQNQEINEELPSDLQAVENRVVDLEVSLDTAYQNEDNEVEELDFEFIPAQPRHSAKRNQCTIL